MNIKGFLSDTDRSNSFDAVAANDAEPRTRNGSAENHSALTHDQLALRNALLRAREHQGVQSVLVTGADEGVGVTSVAVALARGLSWDLSSRILIIEANLHKPCLRQLFNLSALDDGETLALEVTPRLLGMMAVPVDPPNLKVIAADSSNDRVSLELKRIAGALPALRDHYDFVIVDAPPVGSHPEVLVLSPHFDSVAVVAEAGQTSLKELQKIIVALDQAKGKLLGVVLNREKPALPPAIEKWL